jgi:hypothetical protein
MLRLGETQKDFVLAARRGLTFARKATHALVAIRRSRTVDEWPGGGREQAPGGEHEERDWASYWTGRHRRPHHGGHGDDHERRRQDGQCRPAGAPQVVGVTVPRSARRHDPKQERPRLRDSGR